MKEEICIEEVPEDIKNCSGVSERISKQTEKEICIPIEEIKIEENNQGETAGHFEYLDPLSSSQGSSTIGKFFFLLETLVKIWSSLDHIKQKVYLV